jgi:hypothetical protein
MIKSRDPATTRARLHEWVVKQNRRVLPGSVADDTPLLENRIVTSLQIMDLILFIERLRGAPMDVRLIKPGSFRSIDAIMTHCFEEQYHG